MATEAGHFPNRVYIAQDGSLHINGGAIYDSSENTVVLAAATNVPSSATFSPAAGSTNVCLVTITIKDASGTAMAYPVMGVVSLADASTGAGLTATTASGAVAAGASGTDIGTLTSKKALHVQTTAAGVYILSITDSAKTGFYPVFSVGGRTFVGSQLVSGNYG